LEVDQDGAAGCGTWTSLSFSKSMLRVGTPWQNCGTGSSLSDITGGQSIGAILPAYLGHPSLKEDEFASFTTAARTSTIETFVVLDIFSPKAGGTEKVNGEDVVYTNNLDKWTYSSTADAVYAGTTTLTFTQEAYSKCYEAGTPCPLNHNVCDASYCSIDRFGAIQAALKEDKPNMKTLAFIETMQEDGSTPRLQGDIEADVAMYGHFAATTVDGFFFNRVDSTQTAQTTMLKAVAATLTGKTIVFATGQALADESLIEGAGAPDIVVTLSADKEDKLGWNPFAWFPDKPPTQWGALLTNVPSGEDALAELLFDRGYGYVGLHSASTGVKGVDSYGTVSTGLQAALAAIAAADKSASRRLQGRKLAEAPASTYEWSCDAAQFYCAPVCMRTTGLVTSIVPDSKCEGQKQTCSCSCLYDAHWDCVDGGVVCKATHTTRLVPEIVGDLVCATRGTEKPATCIRQLTARGTYPEEQCMTQFEEAKTARLAANVAREEAAAAREAAKAAAAAKADTTTEPTTPAPELKDVVDVQSSALPAALLALAGLFA